MSRDKQIDYKGFANQMRQNAFRNAEGNIVCSEELWELIASTVEAKPADLAEEIFAEIEHTARAAIILLKFEKEEKLRNTKTECYEDLLGYIAELKKKYIGKDINVTTKESEKDNEKIY